MMPRPGQPNRRTRIARCGVSGRLSAMFFLTLTVAMNSCGPTPLKYQALLIGSIGEMPFSDAIWAAKPDGSRLRRVFSPRGGESYLAAWGEYTSGPLFVVVHKLSGSGTKDVLWTADDSFHLVRPLAGKAPNLGQAYPSLSPNKRNVAYVAAPRLGASPGIWIHNIDAGTDEPISSYDAPGYWDTSPAWTSDGAPILFIRGHRIRGGIETELMMVSIGSKQTSTILGTTVSPLAFDFSPDGSRMIAIERDGIEIYSADGRVLDHVADWRALNTTGIYQGSQVAWLPSPDRVIFAIGDRSSKRAVSQVLSIALDTRQVTKLCRIPGRVTSISWLRPPK